MHQKKLISSLEKNTFLIKENVFAFVFFLMASEKNADEKIIFVIFDN